MLNYPRVMILMHLLTLSIESRHLFNLFTMLRWTTPQTDGCNNVTNDLHEVRPETADCNGCTTYGEQWRTGIFQFQDTPISIWDAGNLQAPRKIPAPTWSKIQTCGFVRNWGMPQNSPYKWENDNKPLIGFWGTFFSDKPWQTHVWKHIQLMNG